MVHHDCRLLARYWLVTDPKGNGYWSAKNGYCFVQKWLQDSWLLGLLLLATARYWLKKVATGMTLIRDTGRY